MDQVAQAFGAALATERKLAGFPTQACFSRGTGLSASEIWRFESGGRMPNLQTFARITRVGIDPIPILAAIDEAAKAASPQHDPKEVPHV
jgi:transcriptional regulator with XRE-family HTH domain